jgi:hypothetical protein
MTVTIERVAVEFTDVTMSLPPPNRHHDVIRHHVALTGKYGSGRQGFITSTGAFVNRRKAAEIAYAAGQISRPKKMLFSEDLW